MDQNRVKIAISRELATILVRVLRFEDPSLARNITRAIDDADSENVFLDLDEDQVNLILDYFDNVIRDLTRLVRTRRLF